MPKAKSQGNQIDKMQSIVRQQRVTRFEKHGTYFGSKSTRIYKIPRYDWFKDPDNLMTESHNKKMIPKGRCFHCGYKFNTSDKDPSAVYCVVCSFALATDDFESNPKSINIVAARIRIPNTEPKHLIIPCIKDIDGNTIQPTSKYNTLVDHLQI